MLERRVFTEEHELFRKQFKKFCEREVTPNVERWEEQRIVDRETWKKAGAQGFLCPTLDPKYGYPRSYRRDVLGSSMPVAIDVVRFVPETPGAASSP